MIMVPDEIDIKSEHTKNFQYAHPLSHRPIDDSGMRARLAYDLMEFMGQENCRYYASSRTYNSATPLDSDDEVDIMIVDGNYKEASHLIEQRLEDDPDCEKTLFQKAFLQHLRAEYEKILLQEEQVLKSDPHNVSALINKSFALANLEREEEALEISDKALSLDPNNLVALSNKAMIAKALSKDALREQTLAQAYNVSARNRIRELQKLESKLLRDFESTFIEDELPSAFDEFNLRSRGGTGSSSVH